MNNLSSQSIRTSISSSPSVESVPYRLRPAETIGESFPSRCPPPICMKLACYGTRPQSGPRAAARVFPPTRAAAAVLQKAPRLFRSMSAHARAPLTERAYCAVQTGDTHNAPLTKRVTLFITRIYRLGTVGKVDSPRLSFQQRCVERWWIGFSCACVSVYY